MKEVFKEVYSSISKHKLRSILTGFGISWGMFILIILLGAGNGFRVGILKLFSGYASNSIWVTGHLTSEANIGGIQTGSQIKFNELLISNLKKRFSQIKLISSEIILESVREIEYRGNSASFQIKGIQEDYMGIKLLEVNSGRLFNEMDYIQQRRVVVIGNRVKNVLFGNSEAIGKSINISGVFFQVVGVLSEGTIFSMMEQNSIYSPSETLCNIFNLDKEYYTFGALLHENTTIETFESELRLFLSKEIGISISDKNALYINNIQLQVKAFNALFDAINAFLWVLGLCFLLSGIIGITNIMLVVVKERTVEIGIRKALGATPASIIQLIMAEALIITTLFGFIGLLCGYIGLYCYNWLVTVYQTGQQEIFCKGYIEIHVVLAAFIIIIIFGVLAGALPAQKAAEIMPIETLNKMS